MEHLLTTYIRTKSLCGRSRFDDGTVKLTKNELLKLRHPLGLRIDEISDKLIELKCKGEIKGYGNNFKATKKDGFTKPELLEVTGEKRPRGCKMSIEVTQHVKGARERGELVAMVDPKTDCVHRCVDNGVFFDRRKKTF